MIARRAAFATLAVGWAALLFWLSSQSHPLQFLPTGILSHDKLLHSCAYAVLGFLAFGAIFRGWIHVWRALTLAAVLATIYGATDEWHQRFVPNREADPRDLAADAAGAIVGAAAAAVILRGRLARASIRA